jgi:hypothetical protein
VEFPLVDEIADLSDGYLPRVGDLEDVEHGATGKAGVRDDGAERELVLRGIVFLFGRHGIHLEFAARSARKRSVSERDTR